MASTTTTTTNTKPGHFELLDALRGLAALWVVFFHLTVHDALPDYDDGIGDIVWNKIFGRGDVGVAMFFVLSGFVISHSLRRGLDTRADVGSFMIRRVVRLTPPYWAAIVVVIAFHWLAVTVNDEPFAPGGQPLDWGIFLSQLVYLQGLLDRGFINEVFWTLAIEMQFYIVIAAFLVVAGWAARRHAQGFRIAVWVAAVGSLIGALTDLHPQITFVPTFYSFFLGAMLYWTWTKRLHPGELVLYFALLVAVFVREPDAFLATALVTGGIIVVAGATATGLSTWLSQAPFQFLGRISYSLYLVHVPVQGAVLDIVTKAIGTGTAAVVIATIASTLVSIVASWIFWWAIERPSMRWASALKRTPAPSPAPGTAPSSSPVTS